MSRTKAINLIMQKLITVTIDIEKLQESSKGAFTVNEIEEVNTLLEEGWEIEEWEFITSDKEAEKAIVLLMLNDELYDTENEDADYSLQNFDEEDHELFEDGKSDPEAVATEEEEDEQSGK